MKARPAVAAAMSVVVLMLSGCALSSAGPTCTRFLNSSEADQQTAVIDWAKHHDNRVDAKNPNSFSSGMALFQDRGGLITYCQQPGHGGDHLSNLSPG